MTDEEMKKLWQQVSQKESIQLNQTQLLMNLQNKLSGIDKAVKHRDRLEILAAIIVILFFGSVLYFSSSLQARIGCGIIIASSIFIIYKLVAARQVDPVINVNESVKEHLLASRLKINTQARLLGSVLYWYIFPPYIGLVLLTTSSAGSLWFSIFYIPAVSIFFYFIYRLNKKAAHKLNPIIEQIDQAIEELEA